MKNSISHLETRKTYDQKVLQQILEGNRTHNENIIGQDRAVKAMRLGLGIKDKGFNIYVAGEAGTGKLSAVKSFVEEKAKNEPVPCDLCYVNNFKDSYQPKKLSLPPGKAFEFKKDMKTLINELRKVLTKAFESEEYAQRRKKIVDAFQEEEAKITNTISALAEKESFTVRPTPTGVVTIPLKNNKPLSDEEFNALTDAEKKTLDTKQKKLIDEINAGIREIRIKEKAANEELEKLLQEVAEYATGNLITEINDKYQSSADVISHLLSVKEDILDKLSEFMSPEKETAREAIAMPHSDFLKRYEVTVLVDNSKQKGAPVIIERNPTYNNLIGRVEKESFMGALITDFTMIRKGSLHEANGGYLIIRAEELFRAYFAWEGLKRTLKNKEILIEEAADQLGYITTKSLKPEPIPLDVKVIITGTPAIYQLLYQYDSDFKELFKVKADFDISMECNDNNIMNYISLTNSIVKKESLLPIDNSGQAKIIEYGSRLADDQNKLSTRFGEIGDIIREANYYAMQEHAENIASFHVKKAIEEKLYRSNLIQTKINEMITNKQLFIDIKGEKTGQINGLSVIDIGDIAFGMPSRITCSISLGKDGIITIEREAELSGPIHTKGVLILTGYLTEKFMQDKPLSLTARLVFEQSYSGVEGDSASSTELYAILATFANLPIKQGIAVTGSVNQKGEVQPIGGVNEKIEGYFEVCKKIGLNGEQGVIIPASNKRNLMLKEEIVEAVQQDKFRIWAIDNIDEGIEILTGVKAGNTQEAGSVFFLVNYTLMQYAEKMKSFMKEADEGHEASGMPNP